MKIAVIGAGAFGRRHIETIRAEPACVLAAIADPAPVAGELAAGLRVPHFADHRAMLDRVKPDGVIIATPNASHAPVGLDCAAARVPMLIEKPVAESLEAARALIASGATILVGHHRRHNPIIARAREIVRAGTLGRLLAVNALWLIKKPDGYFDVAWRREAGGGPVLINLIHDIDDLRFIAGEIAAVQAMTANAARGFAVEDTASITLRFAGGALGAILVSDATAAPWSWELNSGENPIYPRAIGDCYVFAGSEGALAVPSLTQWRYKGAPSWTETLSRETLAVEPADPQVLQLRHFIAVIRGEAKPLIDAADAARTLAATLAVRESARTGALVTLA